MLRTHGTQQTQRIIRTLISDLIIYKYITSPLC